MEERTAGHFCPIDRRRSHAAMFVESARAVCLPSTAMPISWRTTVDPNPIAWMGSSASINGRGDAVARGRGEGDNIWTPIETRRLRQMMRLYWPSTASVFVRQSRPRYPLLQ
uniref:Uncharacterized protein n=1 Tax=Plectus sambesii TaxID=2011161 RepID=A0A914X2T7_9BILA